MSMEVISLNKEFPDVVDSDLAWELHHFKAAFALLTKVRLLWGAFDTYALSGWLDEEVSDKCWTALLCSNEKKSENYNGYLHK